MSEQKYEYYNVLFSISSGPLSDDEKEQLSRVKCDWVHLNTRLGRFFVDIIGPRTQLTAIRDKLIELGRDPIVIGIFDSDGLLVGQFNTAEWLKVARDVISYNVDGTVASVTRPLSYIDVHRWAGWAEKQV